ncbi:MAG: protein translocase subunit SecF [Patescibacteria group bacterium]|nr:protein translocase subunit SecF [Patescibacteria group bacterium]MDD4443711.1 protein translocase subunit SecF [Patescibacteria group bacterium]
MIYRIIQKRKFFLSISGVLIAAAIFALVTWGLNFGVDFRGGSLLEAKFNAYQPEISDIQASLAEADINNLTVQPTEDGTFMIRFKDASDEKHKAVVKQLKDLAQNSGQEGASFEELSFDSVGPSIGKELKSKSFNASFIVLIMIILYISWSFRKVSRPISSWKYGVAAIIALAHDVIITLGAFAAFGHFFQIEINTPFIAAILTVLGYSVSDSIVVFDRIRENLPKSKENFEDTINFSINQTLSRSLSTSFSSMLALMAILIFGGSTIQDFALALLIGIFIGTYSSIFVASPILVVWHKLMRKGAKS